jgi:Predicted Rossmann fold nucleotide-binding protein
MEELLEIITWNNWPLFNPIVILNTNNYYDPLIKMLDNAIEETFMLPAHGKIWEVASTPQQAIDLLLELKDNPVKFSKLMS